MKKTVNDKVPAIQQEAIHLPDYDANIAELAYFKAEQRGFDPGHELEDWYKAQHEFLGFE